MKAGKQRMSNKRGRAARTMVKRISQMIVVSFCIAALLVLWTPGLVLAKGLPVAEVQSTKTVQVYSIIQNPPETETPPDTPPETPPDEPPEVPPNTPPDTPPEFPPETPPENPPTTNENPPAENPPSEEQETLPYTGGNAEQFILLGLVIVLAGTAGLYRSVQVVRKEQS